MQCKKVREAARAKKREEEVRDEDDARSGKNERTASVEETQ